MVEDNCTTPPNHRASHFVQTPNLERLLTQTIEVVIRAGQLLIAEWARVDGPRGQGDKAPVDEEIEQFLHHHLLKLLPCDFWGEETGHLLTGHPWCWVVEIGRAHV